MHRRTQVAIAALGFTTLLVTGCSSESSETPTTPNSSAGAAPVGGLPSDGAPDVTDPIRNTSNVETDPCSAATTSQVESLGGKVSGTRVDDLSPGESCAWLFTKSYGNISAGLAVGNTGGLSALYYQSTHGGLTTFQPQRSIEGYPAVIYSNGAERPGHCSLAVGVRNDLVYNFISQLDTGNPQRLNSCQVAIHLAQIIIQNLKESNS